MAKEKRKVTWTKLQREIAALIQEGKTDAEIKAMDYGGTSIHRVRKALAAGNTPGAAKGKLGRPASESPKQTPSESPKQPLQRPPDPSFPSDTRVRVRTVDPIEVGGLFIEPYDWRINQYGGFLITNTYEAIKEGFNYGGTLGDFLCEAVQIVRKIVGLEMVSDNYLLKEEPPNGGGETEVEGQGVLERGDDEADADEW